LEENEMSHQESLTAYTAAFVAELVQSGVTDAVVSPGSRSTPMAMVMAEHPGLNVHIHVDERSAAFFALGMAKASGKPVAILCTSGTAAANYFPAIAEANISRVPLLVITSDRPHELRDVGAPQAIDQIRLYGHHVKWFVEMALPENSDEMLRYVRSVCGRAAATALQAPSGPVHLNFPFREPLIPNLENENLFQFKERPERYVHVHNGELTIGKNEMRELAAAISEHEKGIIVCGQIEDEDFAAAVTELSERLHFPILADPLSQLRSGKHSRANVIDAYDTFLRNEVAKEYLKPTIVLRFGAMPVSKALTIFLKENHQALHYVVDGGGGWRDPAALSTEMIYCKETMFCRELISESQANANPQFLNKWLTINRLTKDNMTVIKDTTEFSESRLFYQLADMLPETANLFVGNSMPIRDLDSFFHNNGKSIRVLANRGANGIDGTISTALGAAAVSSGPLYLVLGDLTFFHDLNGLLAAKLHHIDITIIITNNNGGGIFSFLSQAEHPKYFELLFGTPLDLDYEYVVKMYNGKFTRVESWDHLENVMESSKSTSGLNVIEMVTKRDRNTEEHRQMWNLVSREISKYVNGEQ
jgi:2-succinyl-5-enolpyruvyl-6-hydroxy-3-cyclohexene-1-carboxylate synthase